MSSSELVSIVIPCYNQGPFLRECLESIRKQTYTHCETIVVDDGSQYDTREIIDNLSNTYDFRLVRQANQGLSAARNAGVDQAQGRYILPLDADNYITPAAIHEMVSLLKTSQQSNPEVRFIYQDKVLFGLEDRYVPHQSYNLYRLLTDNFADACSLIDRSIFDMGFRYNETMKQGYEDWEFHLRLGLYGFEGRRLAGRTFFYRRWGYSMVNDADVRRQELFNKLQSELAALYIPSHMLTLKQQWAPAISIVTSSPDTYAGQSFHDWEWLMPDSALTPLYTAQGKYRLYLNPASESRILNDGGLLEKLATWSEHFTERHAIIVHDSTGRFEGIWIRSHFGDRTLRLDHTNETALDTVIAHVVANTDAAYWNYNTQSMRYQPQTTVSVRPSQQKAISRWIKHVGKKYVAPRIGFDNAYQIFVHAYEIFRITRRSLTRRRLKAPEASSLSEATPSMMIAQGEQIDQGFRQYTPVIFDRKEHPCVPR